MTLHVALVLQATISLPQALFLAVLVLSSAFTAMPAAIRRYVPPVRLVTLAQIVLSAFLDTTLMPETAFLALK